MFFTKIESISTEELKNVLKEKDSLLLDVRESYEYVNGHISKARNTPLSSLETFAGDKSKQYYVICQSGMRSQKATKLLQKMGYKAINVTGGMNAWDGEIKRG